MDTTRRQWLKTIVAVGIAATVPLQIRSTKEDKIALIKRLLENAIREEQRIFDKAFFGDYEGHYDGMRLLVSGKAHTIETYKGSRSTKQFWTSEL